MRDGEKLLDVATRTGEPSSVKHTTLTKIESNVVTKPTVQTVAKIAKALGIPTEKLL